MKCAVIDMGSNTVRLSIYKVGEGKLQTLFTVKETAGLVNYIRDEKMTEDGLAKAIHVLNHFKTILEQFSVDQTAVFATASLRSIKNQEDVLKIIYEKTGYEIDVLSGHEEAVCDFYGIIRGYEQADGLVFDIGGGSTEIISFEQKNPCIFESINIGSLKLYRDYVGKIIPKKKEIEKIQRKIRKEFKVLLGCGMFAKDYRKTQVIGVGGSARALLKIVNEFFDKEIENRKIKAGEINELVEMAENKDTGFYKLILKLCPDRIHTLIPGMLILQNIVKETKVKEIEISRYGVREGYLQKKYCI